MQSCWKLGPYSVDAKGRVISHLTFHIAEVSLFHNLWKRQVFDQLGNRLFFVTRIECRWRANEHNKISPSPLNNGSKVLIEYIPITWSVKKSKNNGEPFGFWKRLYIEITINPPLGG